MKSVFPLLKVGLRAMLSSMKLGSGKGKKVGGIGALALLAAVSLYISCVYSFIFGSLLFEAGAGELLIPLMAVLGCLMGTGMTALSAGSFIFGGRDSDLLLSLPVSSFVVMLSKQLALYLECLVFCGLFLLPAGVAYVVYGGGLTASLVLGMLLGILFVPVLAAALCLVIAFLFTLVTARMGRHKIVGGIVSIALFAVFMVGAMQMNTLINLLVQNQAAMVETMHSWLLPFGLLMDGISGSVPSLLGFVAVSTLPFLLLVWIFSACYKKLLTLFKSHSLKNTYRMGSLKTRGQFSALLRKELRRYFGTTMYFLNTGMGMVLLLLAAVYACVMKSQAQPFLEALGGSAFLLPVAALVITLLESMSNPSSVSLSMEGKSFWILKNAPVSASSLFLAKAAVGWVVCWPTAAVSVVAFALVYGVSPWDTAALLVLSLVYPVLVSFAGLILNLLFPKMDWTNETLVIKQSASSMLGIFGTMIFVGLGALVWLALGGVMSFAPLCLLCAAIGAALCALLWRILCTWGQKALQSL